MPEVKYHQVQQQHVRRRSLENVMNIQKLDGYQYDVPGDGVPPNVGKIDGRARILLPQRQPVAVPRSINSIMPTPRRPSNVQRSLANSQQRPHTSRPLFSAVSPPLMTSTPRPTLPSGSNTSMKSDSSLSNLMLSAKSGNKATISDVAYAEKALEYTGILRKEMANFHSKIRKLKDMSKEEMRETMSNLGRIGDVYARLESLSRSSVRNTPVVNMNMKRYGQLDAHVQTKRGFWPHIDPMGFNFDILPEVVNRRIFMEKNVNYLNDQFRHLKYLPRRQSRLVKPPAVLQKKSIYNGLAGLMKSMDMMAKVAQTDPLIWRIEKVDHPKFNLVNSKCLIEVTFTHKRVQVFVPVLKAVLVIKCGILEDLTMGSCIEDLYDEDGIVQSGHAVFREFTKSALSQIISVTVMTKFTSLSSFALCNNYLQNYTHCFSTPCCVCKKLLFNFEIPTMVIRGFPPIICHRFCYKFSPISSSSSF